MTTLSTCADHLLHFAPIEATLCLGDWVLSNCRDLSYTIDSFIQQNKDTKLFIAAELAAGAAGICLLQKGIRDYKKGETHKGISEACGGVACLALFAFTNSHIERGEAAFLLVVSAIEQYRAAPGRSRSFF